MALRKIDEQWWECNDEQITPITDNDLSDNDIGQLFFSRRIDLNLKPMCFNRGITSKISIEQIGSLNVVLHFWQRSWESNLDEVLSPQAVDDIHKRAQGLQDFLRAVLRQFPKPGTKEISKKLKRTVKSRSQTKSKSPFEEDRKSDSDYITLSDVGADADAERRGDGPALLS